jgi:SAM-dependent methyltransferase
VSETELPGRCIDLDTLEIIAHRYSWASSLVRGKEVLEVGCGPGLGLGCLSRHAKRVIGGDVTEESIMLAKKHYGRRVELAHLDAHRMPFKDHSIDTVICLATIIYMDLPIFLEECRRVLKSGGTLAMNTPNKDQPGFEGSLLSRAYFSVPEFHSLLQQSGFESEFFGAFPIRHNGPASRSLPVSRPDILSFRKWAGKTLRLLGLYGTISRLHHRQTRRIMLTEELKQKDINLVEGVQVAPISCSAPNREHRIIYVTAQARS